MTYSYLLDSNVFIQAHRFYYPGDVFPGFWEWLESQNTDGVIASVDQVYKELEKGKDELFNWAKAQKSNGWFLSVQDKATQVQYAEMANWILKQNYTQPALEDFLEKADLWLISKARTTGATVVTQEKSNPESKKKIFIPDICDAFNIGYCNTVDLLRELEATI
jgi:uncharacterized protein DUF4411